MLVQKDHKSMTEYLWDCLATIARSHDEGPVKGSSKSAGGNISGRKVQAAKLHELAKVRPSKQTCLVKDLSLKKARLVAKLAVDKWKKSPSEGGFQASLDAVITKIKDNKRVSTNV
jgi:hypothetical protein